MKELTSRIRDDCNFVSVRGICVEVLAPDGWYWVRYVITVMDLPLKWKTTVVSTIAVELH